MHSAQDRRRTWAIVVVAPALCATLFAWPTLDAPFRPGDDTHLVLHNPLVRELSPSSVRELATSIHGDLYQPLPMFSFQLSYAFARDNPLPYRVVNLALHAACAILAAALAWRLSNERSIAVLTGVLFSVHPLAMDAVGWISGRILLMAALFSLALLNLVAWRPPKPGVIWAGGSLLAGCGMLLSKVIPGVPFAAAWVDAWSHEPTGTLRRRPLIWWASIATLVAITIIMIAISLNTARTAAMAGAAESAGIARGVRMLLALRYYLENYFVPLRLTEWSPVPRDVGWASHGVRLAGLEVVALIVLALIARRRAPVAMIGLGLFALLMLPFLAAVGVRTLLTADRYMYLPMAGLNLAVAAGVIETTKALGWRWARLPMGALVCAALIGLLIVARGEAAIRRDFVAVARRAMELHPDDVRIPVQLSKTLHESGRAREALKVIDEARRRWPDDPGLAGEAGAAHRALGDWKAAFDELQRAVASQPDDLRARYHLALTLDDSNLPDAAAAQYRKILSIRSDHVPAAVALARNLRRAGKNTEALAFFEQALKTNPHHRGALLGSAEILRDLSRYEDAEPILRNLVAATPDDRRALLALQDVLWAQHRFASVVELWRHVIKARPDNSEWAAWQAWAEVVLLLTDEQQRPAAPFAKLNDGIVARFADCVRRGRLESPAYLTHLTELLPAASEADDASLGALLSGLGNAATLHPRDPVIAYVTCVALALRGDIPLARQLRQDLHPVGLAWNDPIAALNVLLESRRSLTTSAPSP